jgi:sodium transport system permease protein
MTFARSLRQIAIVMRKEIKDSLRDRRALWSIVFSVTIGPLIIGFMMNRVADRQREAEHVRVPVVGMQYAPALVDWLRQQSGVEIVEGPANPEEAVRNQEEELAIIIPPNFAEKFNQSRPALLQIVADSSRNDARPTVERVRRLLQQYGAEIGSLRLIARGVSPAAARPIDVEDIEVSTAQQRAAQILTFIPMFIIMAGFVGGMQIATDSTAGERERGSLEPLLVNPAPRLVFVGGKWLAAALAAVASTALTTLLCAILPRFLPLEDMGIRFRIGPEHMTGLIAAAVPMCLFSAALQSAVATLARSFKEAQSYMGVLVLLPMIPGVMGALYPLGNAPWMYATPVLGPYVLLTNVLGGQPPSINAFLTSAGISLVAAAILVRVTSTLFESEKIIFGR